MQLYIVSKLILNNYKGPGFCKWQATGGCKWDGKREFNNDKSCDQVISDGMSGSCACSDGSVKMKKGCHAVQHKTCNDACKGTSFDYTGIFLIRMIAENYM